MKTINLKGTVRTDVGKKSSKSLRREGNVPCVIYGESTTTHFFAPLSDFNELLHSPSFAKVKVDVDGKESEAIIKDMQFHPVTDQLLHVDFLQLQPGKAVITEIPVKTEGRAKGVAAGGKLLTKVRKLKVKATPENLQDFIVVDVTNLALNKSIKVKDLNEKLTTMEIMHSESIPIASVVTPRTLRTGGGAEGEEGEGEEGAEVEATEGGEPATAEATE